MIAGAALPESPATRNDPSYGIIKKRASANVSQFYMSRFHLSWRKVPPWTRRVNADPTICLHPTRPRLSLRGSPVFFFMPGRRGWSVGRDHGEFLPEQLQADFLQMRNALEKNHPDRLRYETAETLAGLFDAAFASLQNNMTEVEFYRVVAPLVARYHCGHTRISPANGFSPGLVMPLGIYLADGKAYVDADYGSDPSLPLGREVLAINNEPIAAIIERMQAGISSDALEPVRQGAQLEPGVLSVLLLFLGRNARVRPDAEGSRQWQRVSAAGKCQAVRPGQPRSERQVRGGRPPGPYDRRRPGSAESAVLRCLAES